MDWGAGNYARIAKTLLPAARAVVDQARIRAEERVLDVGCGTGNAALLAAESGARATGVDPAQALLDVASRRAAEAELEASFLRGDAGQLPLADGSADAIVSVFGVIFAPDANAAGHELARVSSQGGRILLSAWIPGGAVSEVMRLRGEALASTGAAPAGPPPFAWHDAAALDRLFGPLGFALTLHEHELSFNASSSGGFLDAELRDHPMWVSARATLDRQRLDALRERALAILDAANESPDEFRVSSSYVVAELRRG